MIKNTKESLYVIIAVMAFYLWNFVAGFMHIEKEFYEKMRVITKELVERTEILEEELLTEIKYKDIFFALENHVHERSKDAKAILPKNQTAK